MRLQILSHAACRKSKDYLGPVLDDQLRRPMLRLLRSPKIYISDAPISGLLQKHVALKPVKMPAYDPIVNPLIAAFFKLDEGAEPPLP